MQISDKANADIQEALGEIKNTLQGMQDGLAAVKREVLALHEEKKYPSELICRRLDTLLRGFSYLMEDIKPITPLSILTSYQIKHPEQLDTEPIGLADALTKAASEIQDEVDGRCKAFCAKMAELTEARDPVQCLADYSQLLKDLRDEIVSRRARVDALKERRRKADKDSNEQANAAILIVKVRSMIEPLEKFSEIVLESYFKKRKRIIAEVWKTTCAIEGLYDTKSQEYKEKIPEKSAEAPITTALKELTEINIRHMETNKANALVKSGNMTALERRKMMADINAQHLCLRP